MSTNVETMCKRCANLKENGECKLAWVTPRDQQGRAKAGHCGDAEVMKLNGSTVEASAVLIPEKWIR